MGKAVATSEDKWWQPLSTDNASDGKTMANDGKRWRTGRAVVAGGSGE